MPDFITLAEGKGILLDSVAHEEAADFTDTQQERGIRSMGRRFNRETHCDTELIDFTVTAGTTLFDLTTVVGLGDFVRDQFQMMFRRDDEVDLAFKPFRDLKRRSSGKSFEDEIERVAFPTDYEAFFSPAPKVDTVLTLLRRKPFVTFAPPVVDDTLVDLNIPIEWVDQAIWSGAKYYMLHGAPGHSDVQTALAEFNALIIEAKAHFVDGRPGLADRSSHPSQASSERARAGV